MDADEIVAACAACRPWMGDPSASGRNARALFAGTLHALCANKASRATVLDATSPAGRAAAPGAPARRVHDAVVPILARLTADFGGESGGALAAAVRRCGNGAEEAEEDEARRENLTSSVALESRRFAFFPLRA